MSKAREFRFVAVSCQGSIPSLIVVSGCDADKASELANQHFKENYDSSTCDQCFDAGWSLYEYDPEVYTIDEYTEVIQLSPES